MSGLMGEHWLTFQRGRGVTGCHCGFDADLSDEGWGFSVSQHIAAEAIREAVMAWAEVTPDDGVAFNRAEVADVLFRHADLIDGGPWSPDPCDCTVMPDGVDICRWCRGDG